VRRGRRAGDHHRDDAGVAAVEMAIVTPLLLLLLFGIIQYGMLFHSMQAASATARDATTQASRGTVDCAPFIEGVKRDAAGNGVPASPDPWQLTMTYDLTVAQTNPYGTVTVDLAYTPQSFVPFIPMPGRLHQTALAPVEDITQITVTSCTVDP
jgi:Flp pilus assembly protein TadG